MDEFCLSPLVAIVLCTGPGEGQPVWLLMKSRAKPFKAKTSSCDLAAEKLPATPYCAWHLTSCQGPAGPSLVGCFFLTLFLPILISSTLSTFMEL